MWLRIRMNDYTAPHGRQQPHELKQKKITVMCLFLLSLYKSKLIQ